MARELKHPAVNPSLPNMKSTPGPLPSSCLSCRQKKTRCDRARPACSRCIASGIACLGYDHIPAADPSSFYVFSFDSRRPTSPLHGQPKTRLAARAQENLSSEGSCGSESTNSRVDQHDQGSQMVVSDGHEAYCEVFSAPGVSGGSHVQARLEVARPVSHIPLSDGYQPSTNNDFVQPVFSSRNMSERLLDPATHLSLPPKIIPNPALSGEIPEFIMSQYAPLFEAFLFKPPRVFPEMVRKRITTRIYSSTLSRYSLYIGARIIQALANDGKRADLRDLSSYLRIFEQHLIIRSTNESTFDGLTIMLATGLELVFAYFVTSNSQAGYTLLRNLIPTFARVALFDFDLLSCRPDWTTISLAHVLNPPHPSIYRFVLKDIFTSLMFGVPLLIEYDTSLAQLSATWTLGRISPADAVPELAPEYLMTLVKISVWRAKNPGQSAPEDVWKPLEAELWACQQSADVTVEVGTLQSVARMTIVEGWRHAILIHLYMGMCGVASNDTRVQSSTKQIMQLLRVVRREGWNTMNHFFIPCLMASICTPNEKHRAELSNAFLKVEDTKPWLFKAMECKPVIDHLWHGAAANGRPVYWEDYVDSRRAMLRID